ncbi:MAG: UDP-N-acetylmuramoylalanyl-D-glutamyl-2,6-diaminopimelate--D-alanyl-D-alanine ligase [Bauldia sp.]|nr:UDP-N-acetylmuramoylalanyl-D-glutamyl-2,6-diaminopimelate--D-alanyl-D-alanine ligase [Bauldia sp.]
MSGSLWTFAEIVAATRGRPVGPEPRSVDGIAIDSRTLQPGDAFFAIRGDRFDGHAFVGSALAHGAATAIVSTSRLAALGRVTGSMIVVDDVMEALRGLARAARMRTRAKIVAVTGSVGKTSTKDMLLQALGGIQPTHGAPASFNNHWGVPLTLARMPAESGYGVFEIGMNHAGEIAPLVSLVRPHAAIITTVEAVHLEAFGSVEEIAFAKAEILTGLDPAGTAILNRDNAYFDVLSRVAVELGIKHIVGFGVDRDAGARLDDVVLDADGSTVSATILGREITYVIGAPGRHLVQNSLAVLAAAAAIGADTEAVAAGLASFHAGKGRGERSAIEIGGGNAVIIDESYNANPASMRAALALLAQTAPGPGGRRIAVLGDMLELGTEELALHAGLAEPVVDAGADAVFLAGPRMKALWEALPADRRGVYAGSAAELESALAEALAPEDVIMVKGSNGSRMGPLVESLKRRFAPRPLGVAEGAN